MRATSFRNNVHTKIACCVTFRGGVRSFSFQSVSCTIRKWLRRLFRVCFCSVVIVNLWGRQCSVLVFSCCPSFLCYHQLKTVSSVDYGLYKQNPPRPCDYLVSDCAWPRNPIYHFLLSDLHRNRIKRRLIYNYLIFYFTLSPPLIY